MVTSLPVDSPWTAHSRDRFLEKELWERRVLAPKSRGSRCRRHRRDGCRGRCLERGLCLLPRKFFSILDLK